MSYLYCEGFEKWHLLKRKSIWTYSDGKFCSLVRLNTIFNRLLHLITICSVGMECIVTLHFKELITLKRNVALLYYKLFCNKKGICRDARDFWSICWKSFQTISQFSTSGPLKHMWQIFVTNRVFAKITQIYNIKCIYVSVYFPLLLQYNTS